MKTENKLTVTGRIVSMKGKYITVFIPGNRDLYIRTLITSQTEMPKDLKQNARVSITGHCSGYLAPDKTGRGGMSKVQYFIADKIEKQTTLLDQCFGVKGRFYDTGSCRYIIAGNVTSVSNDGDWTRLTIMTDMDSRTRRVSSVHLSVYKNADARKILKGDMACVACVVSSPKKEINGKMMYFEDIIGIDIAKVDEEKAKDASLENSKQNDPAPAGKTPKKNSEKPRKKTVQKQEGNPETKNNAVEVSVKATESTPTAAKDSTSTEPAGSASETVEEKRVAEKPAEEVTDTSAMDSAGAPTSYESALLASLTDSSAPDENL